MVATRLFCASLWGLALPALAQQPADTLRRQRLDDVVVTATRTEKSITEVPIPVSVVGAKQIKAMGSLRLNDVLGEQTGLNIVTDHGRGIQMQGLSPEYTLILVDGEPLIGRTAGTLELSRVAVGNIQRIEVVKGPASALWGSDALAGVVNIITCQPQDGTSGELRVRYGTNRTADLTGKFNVRGPKLGATIFLNRYSSAGYTLQPESGTPTVPPFAAYTAQSRVSYQFSDRTKLSVSGRYFIENQNSVMRVTGEDGTDKDVRMKTRQQDYSLNPVLTHRAAGGKLFTTTRLYVSGYRTQEDYTYAVSGQPYDATYFNQYFTRPEVQVDWSPTASHTITGGAGYVWETVAATRYDQRQRQQIHYAFAQYDWTPLPKLNVVGGLRYDGHSQYAGQISPKLSARYQVRPWLALRGSAGRGYRAPDFRQLYLNFSNPVVGYSVFGTSQVRDKVAQLAAQGQLTVDPATGQPVVYQAVLDQASGLTAESSLAYNVGFVLEPRLRNEQYQYRFSANAFRNDLTNLIETATVALKKNGQAVYSYRNITRAYTQGLELENSLRLPRGLTLSGGYQYLIAKDKTVAESVEAGQVFRKDADGETRRVRPGDYGGLFNRSRHTWNAKLFYENESRGWTASLRAIYRGRYGFGDLNQNAILDAASEYVVGYTVWNVAASKIFYKRYTLQVNVDNLFNHTNPAFISTLPGRLFYASLGVELGKRAN